MLDEWRNRWLEGNPCRAPCWEGVTPGQTSADDALRIWGASKLMRDLRLSRANLLPNWGNVVWDWTTGREGGLAAFNKQTTVQKINDIQVTFPWTYNLNEIIAAYGDPTYVVATATCYPDSSGSSYDAQIYFLSSAFVVYESGPFTRESANQALDSSKSIRTIRFFRPVQNLAELEFSGGGVAYGFAVPWKGTFQLGAYLRDETYGRCFSPTPTQR